MAYDWHAHARPECVLWVLNDTSIDLFTEAAVFLAFPILIGKAKNMIVLAGRKVRI